MDGPRYSRERPPDAKDLLGILICFGVRHIGVVLDMTLDEAAEEYLDKDFSDDVWPDQHFKAGAEWAVKNDPRVLELVEASRGVMWINKCGCDIAYTGRGMHEPNSLCGELDLLEIALSKWKGTP